MEGRNSRRGTPSAGDAAGRSRLNGREEEEAMKAFPIAAAAALLPLGAPAAAAPPLRLDAESALAIVTACRDSSALKRQSHSVAVVDAGGSLLAALRMNGNPPGTIEFALEKARAVAAWGFST